VFCSTTNKIISGFEVIREVFLKISIFCDMHDSEGLRLSHDVLIETIPILAKPRSKNSKIEKVVSPYNAVIILRDYHL
jgi:hypothetical protein